MAERKEPERAVLVKLLSGKKQIFNMPESSTILNLKTKIREQDGIDEKQIRLLYKGKILNDTDVISKLNIDPNVAIMGVMNLK